MTDEQKDSQASLEDLLVPPDSSNPDEGTDSGLEPEAGLGQEPGQSEMYSSEEFEQILTRNPLDIEPDRVPPELMPAYKLAMKAYKNFQADYTRKTQQIAQAKEQDKPKTIYEAYDRDPDGVTAEIDIRIAKAREEGNFDEALNLINLKNSLIEYKTKKLESMTRQQNEFQEIFAEVRREIPNFEQKAPALVEFAIKELGFSEEEIEKLTDPSITGKLAAKLTLAVNRAYDRAYAGKTIARKEVKPQPNRTVPAQGTKPEQETESILNYKPGQIMKMSSKEFEKLLRDVKMKGFQS